MSAPDHTSCVTPETKVRFIKAANWSCSLAHAYGAVCDNPDLPAACVIGDDEAKAAVSSLLVRKGRVLRFGEALKGRLPMNKIRIARILICGHGPGVKDSRRFESVDESKANID